MLRLPLHITILHLLITLTITNVNAQDIFATCNRTTIESLPGHEKVSVLNYLDDSRKVADEFVRLLAEGKFNEIYSVNKMLRIYVQGNPNVAMDLATFEKEQGRITNSEYRNQEIVWQLGNRLGLRENVYTWYSVKTTRTKRDLSLCWYQQVKQGIGGIQSS